MRYVLKGPLKEYRNKKAYGYADKERIKLTETILLTPTSIQTNQTKHQNKV